MTELADVQEVLERYKDSYDRVRKLKALCHDDEAEAGTWLWEAYRHGFKDVTNDSWYWGLLEDAPDGYTAADLAALITDIGNSTIGMAQLAGAHRELSGWNFYLDQMLDQKFDGSAQLFINAWKSAPTPLDVGFGYALAARGALDASQLPESTLTDAAAVLVDGTSSEQEVERGIAIWGEPAFGAAVANAAGEPGVGIWSVEWMPLALPHASARQAAQWVLNIDYAPTAEKMIWFVANNFKQPEYDAIEALLVDVVDLENINYYQNPPLQKLGFQTAAVVLANRAIATGNTLSEVGEKAYRRALAQIANELAEPLTRGLAAIEPSRREAIILELLADDESYNRTRWKVLPGCQTPKVISRAVELVRALPRGEPYDLSYALGAFQRFGPEAAQPLVDAGWDKSPQRHVIAVGLAATAGENSVERLLELLADSLESVRDAATEGLRKVAPASKDLLLSALRSRKKTVRLHAAQALTAAPLTGADKSAIEAMVAKEKVDEVARAMNTLVAAGAGGTAAAGSPLDAARAAVPEVAFAMLVEDLRELVPEEEAEEFDTTQWEAQARNTEHFAIAALEALDEWWVPDNHKATAWCAALKAAPSDLLMWAAVNGLAVIDWDDDGTDHQATVLKVLVATFGDKLIEPLLAYLDDGCGCGEVVLDWLTQAAPDQSLEFARRGFGSGEPGARYTAQQLLPKLPGGREVLVELLGAKKADARLRAIAALRQTSSEGLADLFGRALETDRSSKVKDALRVALYEIEAENRPPIAEVEASPANHAELDAWLGSNAPPAPKGLDLDALPSLVWTTGANVSQQTLCWILGRIEAEGPGDDDLQALRHHLDRAASASVLEGLRAQFGPESDEGRLGWVLHATALFATDEEMVDFGRGLDDEARYGSSSQAFKQLNVLRWHGAPAALQWIDHWARRAKSRGLRERGELALGVMARELGITPQELSERAMSDYGFDSHGRQQLQWGGRGVITLSLGGANEILMHDESGKLWKSYPGALKGDDADEIKALKSSVSSLKKQVKQATTGQIERMEQAMSSGRQWAPAAWLEVYLANPLIANLAQHILWSAFTPDGKFLGGFRVDADLSLANLDDEPFELKDCLIRIAHPYYLGQEATAAWSEVFADYELLPPFEQFERPLYVANEEELKFDEVRRFSDLTRGASKFRAHFEKCGWIRGTPQDGGAVMWLTKPFRAADVTAVIWVDPGFSVANYGDWEEEQAVERLIFLPGQLSDPGWKEAGMPIATVDPVVFSEALNDVVLLAGA